jgi:hypothetical protein
MIVSFIIHNPYPPLSLLYFFLDRRILTLPSGIRKSGNRESRETDTGHGTKGHGAVQGNKLYKI